MIAASHAPGAWRHIASVMFDQGLHGQLATLLPSKTSAEPWAMEGATIMNGLDDYPRRTGSTSVADAQQLPTFARANGLATLSM